jgi:hypothetical protein
MRYRLLWCIGTQWYTTAKIDYQKIIREDKSQTALQRAKSGRETGMAQEHGRAQLQHWSKQQFSTKLAQMEHRDQNPTY